jgi:topoisomerase-4 subunit A
VIDEIRADMKKYGDPRRTLIETAQAITASSASEESLVDEPVTVIVSRNGWVRARQGHGIDPAGIQYKAGDGEMAVIETRSIWPLVLLDSGGRTYTLRIPDLPGGRGDGAPLTSLVEFPKGARVLYALSAAPETRYLVATDVGYGFVCKLADLLSRQRAGKAFLTVEEGYAPLPPARLTGDWVAAAASNGRCLVFPLAEMKEGAGGKGVQIMKLEDGETLTALAVFAGQKLTVSGLGRSKKPASLTLGGVALDLLRAKRARKGQPLDKGIVANRLEDGA